MVWRIEGSLDSIFYSVQHVSMVECETELISFYLKSLGDYTLSGLLRKDPYSRKGKYFSISFCPLMGPILLCPRLDPMMSHLLMKICPHLLWTFMFYTCGHSQYQALVALTFQGWWSILFAPFPYWPCEFYTLLHGNSFSSILIPQHSCFWHYAVSFAKLFLDHDLYY